MSREYVLHSFRREVDFRINYAAELNPQQYEAATAGPGPALVLAGAGSGKTRTLTYRVAYLIEQGVAPERILLLTFTNKAAKEMMRRVADLLGTEMSALWGGTFHSIGARILRANAEAVGFRKDFTILDREDSEALIKSCLAAASEDPPQIMLPNAGVTGDLISRAANERRPLAEIWKRQRKEAPTILPLLEGVAAAYRERKRAANVMDFDDLLVLWLELLEKDPAARERYQQRFQWILVDEYQDTNRIQSDLIDLLAAGHGNLMAVGDDSQSIYSWRGADFRNILDFPQRHTGSRVYKVEVNYRSTPEILAVANAAIAHNTRQFAKQLTAARPAGIRPVLVSCEDPHQQASFVAQRVLEAHEEGTPLREMAVLYRSHFHALELQMELTRRGIPFLITSGIRFFEQAHIKDVAAWLKLIANPFDELAFKRLVLLLPGVGPKAADKLWNAFRGTVPPPPGEPPATTPSATPVAAGLMAIRASVPKKALTAWAQVAATVAQLETPPLSENAGAMIRGIVDAFYEDYAENNFPNGSARLDDLEQLASFAAQFPSLSEFLTQLSLLNNLESEAEQRSASAQDERLRLSTVHQAKGLEFQVVFVIMLAEGMFPSARSLESPDDAEEERRLFYVAVTRARDELYLAHPLLRISPGQGMSLLSKSRFLDEVPAELIEEWNLRPSPSWRDTGPRREAAPPNEFDQETPGDPF